MGHKLLKCVRKGFGNVAVIPPLSQEIEDGGFVVFLVRPAAESPPSFA